MRTSPKAQRAAGRRSPDPHARARPLLPEGAPAAPRARRVLSEDRRGLHPDRHDRDRRASHAPGIPCVGRRPVALPIRPRAHGPEGPRHPGVHRPRARPDDPAHPRAQARARRPQHLQRLLVLGAPLVVDLWHDLRAVSSEIRPDWDLSAPGLREAWEADDLSPFHGWNKRGAGSRTAEESRSYVAAPSGGSASS